MEKTHDLLVVANDETNWLERKNWVTREGLDLLEAVGTVKNFNPSAYANTDDEKTHAFEGVLQQTDAVIFAPWGSQGLELTPHCLDNAHRLKVISGTFDNRFSLWLDVADAKQRGITVIDTSRSMTPTVAEFALAMMLNLLRDIPHEIDQVRQGKWQDGWYDIKGFVAGDLTGRRVGLAGFGSICRRLSELLQPFRCDIRTYDPFVSADTLANYDVSRAESLVEMAAWSELFVVGIPPTPKTLGVISKQVIDAMPNGALFVLVTRMAVVEQEALWQRTFAGEIRAAVDVFAPEPPPSDSPIRSNQYVIPTPHIAGNTVYCHQRCFTTACQDAVAALTGEPLKYEASVWDSAMYSGKTEAHGTV